jgi:uncharacterized membrane protein YgdD (TMEM256/DUF423 family)
MEGAEIILADQTKRTGEPNRSLSRIKPLAIGFASLNIRMTGTKMRSQMTAALYVILMAAVIVAVDVLFFKNRFWERLTVNVGIVLVFAAFYFRYLKHP